MKFWGELKAGPLAFTNDDTISVAFNERSLFLGLTTRFNFYPSIFLILLFFSTEFMSYYLLFTGR